jgi:glycosyltransferase involved in cell wall biosynthesis
MNYKPMNIAFLTSEYPHLRTGTSGGIGTSIKNLASSFVKNNHKVHVVVIGQKEDATFSDNGITIHQLKNRKWKGLSWWLTAKKIEKKINQLCQEEGVELVEVQDYLGILAFVSCPCKTVLKLHGSDTYFCHLDQRPVKWWNKFQEQRAFKKADAIVAVSQFAGDLSNLVFSSNRPFEVIGNGIDSHQFVPAPPNSNNTILYFGTLIRKKGLLELAAIFNEVYAPILPRVLHLHGK